MLVDTEVLPRSFYQRHPVTVARDLLGKILVRELEGCVLAGRIVETEAYLAADDPASHAFAGKTRRNAAMFGPPGHAYVYIIYGRYHCVNVVTEEPGVASAVLLRAVEPLAGVDRMQRLRAAQRLTQLASGPGKLCQAFAIDRTWDTWDLTQGQGIWCAQPAVCSPFDIVVTPRVGIVQAADLPLRFCMSHSAFVSRGPRR
jgi:DNA-3-methyladenine glycosylase